MKNTFCIKAWLSRVEVKLAAKHRGGICVPDINGYLSADEGEDVHLSGVGVLHRRHNEAGSAQRDLTLGPAVHRQSQLPFAHVEHAGQLHALRAPHAARLTCGGRKISSLDG